MKHNYTEKSPIDTSELDSFASDDPTIAEACIDYLGIEHMETKREVTTHLRQTFQQRFLTGKSVAVTFTSVEYVDEEESEIEITAQIDYSSLNTLFEDPSDVLSGLRLKGQSGATSGSFVNAIPVDTSLEPIVDEFENRQYKVPTITIGDITIENPDDLSELKKPHVAEECDAPVAGTITLTVIEYVKDKSRFFDSVRPPQIEDSDDPFHFSEGDTYILDRSANSYTANSAYRALQNPELSDFNEFLEQLLDGDAENTSKAFDANRIDEFIEWTRSDDYPNFGLNEKQAAFTRDTSHELSLLQGPPGTGKTSGAVAPAIVSRLLAYQGNGPCRTLVTGASNKSIDEVMGDTVALVDEFTKAETTSDALDDVMFLRVADKPSTGHVFEGADELSDHTRENIEYNGYNGDEDDDVTIMRANQRLRKEGLSNIDSKHIVVFATSRRAWKVAKNVIGDSFRLGDNDEKEHDDIRNVEKERYSLFDVIVADEASMMDLPSFLLAATFYDRGGNILLSGDHRQLPPVQQHDWESEFRPSIRAAAPYLSLLNFFRVVRGEELHELDDELKKYLDVKPQSLPDIPLHQLETTYRCHTRVTTFLREWVYMNLDGLDYQSGQTDHIHPPTPVTPGIDTVLDPDAPLVLVTYDDTTHQQSNPLEMRMIRELLHGIDRSETTTGIVTPHNAQRGLLDTHVNAADNTTTDTASDGGDVVSTDVDTVERFQGGERDMMILSGTVSDPDYIAAESDFLLNLNRLNVSMSRMKQKLVVVAAESIFDHIPTDTDEYNQALLWKGLADEAGLADSTRTADWTGSMTAFTGLSESDFTASVTDTTVRVYQL